MTTAEPIRIVEFHAGQADELVRMWRASFEQAVGVTDPHPLQEQRAYLLNVVVPRNAVRVAFNAGEIVGFVAASKASVAQLYVRIGFQRRGLGTRLLDWAKSRSDGSLWLYTFARNTGACAFYERSGFHVAARGFEPEWQLEDVRYEWSASGHKASGAA